MALANISGQRREGTDNPVVATASSWFLHAWNWKMLSSIVFEKGEVIWWGWQIRSEGTSSHPFSLWSPSIYTMPLLIYTVHTHTHKGTRTHTWGINQRLCCHGTPYLLIEACIHNMRLYKMSKWKTYINVKTSALAWKREWMNVSIYLKRWTK